MLSIVIPCYNEANNIKYLFINWHKSKSQSYDSN